MAETSPRRRGSALGSPTPGAGQIERRHRYEHEHTEARVAALEATLAQLQQNLGQPGGSGGPGATFLPTGTGDNQGSLPGSDNQGPPVVVGPAGPPGPPGPPGTGDGTVSLPPIIAFWHSANGPIPAGWARCDGSNGTPDLITGDPLLQLSGSSGLIGGTSITGAWGLDIDDFSHTAGCYRAGTETSGDYLVGPIPHTHTGNVTWTFATDVLKPNLTRYGLIPIMFVG